MARISQGTCKAEVMNKKGCPIRVDSELRGVLARVALFEGASELRDHQDRLYRRCDAGLEVPRVILQSARLQRNEKGRSHKCVYMRD